MSEHAVEVAAGPVDGVGLLRAEFMVADALDGTAFVSLALLAAVGYDAANPKPQYFQ